MKLRAYISPVLYKQFCRVNWLEDNQDSIRRFLREIGTHSILFQDLSGNEYQDVPPGTCVRLHTSDTYGVLSTRYLNLYATLYSKQEEVRLETKPSVKVASIQSSWWCWGRR
jgi:hypothetical protein